jgi:hypothetical protein
LHRPCQKKNIPPNDYFASEFAEVSRHFRLRPLQARLFTSMPPDSDQTDDHIRVAVDLEVRRLAESVESSEHPKVSYSLLDASQNGLPKHFLRTRHLALHHKSNFSQPRILRYAAEGVDMHSDGMQNAPPSAFDVATPHC